MDTREMLMTLCGVDGNSGNEKKAAELAKDILSAYGKTYIDNLGSVICEVAPKKNGRHVMLDAHLDQIALIVINIEENGFLRTFPCGGIDRRGICGTKVRAIGKDGEYLGVVCSVPPHIKDVNEKNPESVGIPDFVVKLGGSVSNLGNSTLSTDICKEGNLMRLLGGVCQN